MNTTKQPLATRDNRSNKVLQQGGGALLKRPVEEPGAEGRLQGTRLLGFNRVLQKSLGPRGGPRVRDFRPPGAAAGTRYETFGRQEPPTALGYDTFRRLGTREAKTSTRVRDFSPPGAAASIRVRDFWPPGAAAGTRVRDFWPLGDARGSRVREFWP